MTFRIASLALASLILVSTLPSMRADACELIPPCWESTIGPAAGSSVAEDAPLWIRPPRCDSAEPTLTNVTLTENGSDVPFDLVADETRVYVNPRSGLDADAEYELSYECFCGEYDERTVTSPFATVPADALPATDAAAGRITLDEQGVRGEDSPHVDSCGERGVRVAYGTLEFVPSPELEPYLAVAELAVLVSGVPATNLTAYSGPLNTAPVRFTVEAACTAEYATDREFNLGQQDIQLRITVPNIGNFKSEVLCLDLNCGSDASGGDGPGGAASSGCQASAGSDGAGRGGSTGAAPSGCQASAGSDVSRGAMPLVVALAAALALARRQRRTSLIAPEIARD